jgi:hypothetical protein
MYRFAYLVLNGILAVFWLILFFWRKDLRKQQLFFGLLAPLAPLTDFLWFYHDYWRPEYAVSFKVGQVTLGIESLLFAFLSGGIAGVVYEAVFRKRHQFGKPRSAVAITMILSGLIIMAILINLGLNSIWASSFALLIVASIIVLIDKDLVKDAVFSGVLMTLLITIFYVVWLTIYPEVIQRFWVVEALSGIRLWKIPIEELIWFFAAGMTGGVFYEFWLNVEKYPQKQI